MAEKTWTDYWHQQQVDAYQAEQPTYTLYASILERLLVQARLRLKIEAWVSSRPKAVVSFAEKAVRKAHKYKDPVHELTDLCGVRVVTHTKEEADRIGAFIEANVVVDRENSGNAGERLEPDQFGYRAMHYVVQMPWVSLLGRPAFRQAIERMEATYKVDLSAHLQKIAGREADDVLRVVLEEQCTDAEGLFEALRTPETTGRPETSAMTPEGVDILRDVFDQLRDEGITNAPLADACCIGNRKAEIQICTILQHAWAAISHDRLYKSNFEAPKALKRQLHRTSALLEEGDEELARGIAHLNDYMLDYGAYMTDEEIEEEIHKRDMVARREPDDPDLALKIAGLARAIEDWQKVVATLKGFVGCGNADVLTELGLARSKRHAGGRDELSEAVRLQPDHGAAWCYLGDTYCPLSDTYPNSGNRKADCCQALAHYARAFEAAPADPLALRKYVECKVCHDADAEALTLLQPALDAAYTKCFNRAAVHVHVPAALYEMGEFALLMNRPFESLGAYAKAVFLSRDDRPILDAMLSLKRLAKCLKHSKPAWGSCLGWVRRFLVMARLAKLLQMQRAAPAEIQRRRQQADARSADLDARITERERAEVRFRETPRVAPARGAAGVPNGAGFLARLQAGESARKGAVEAVAAAREAEQEASHAVDQAREAVRKAQRASKQIATGVRKARQALREAGFHTPLATRRTSPLKANRPVVVVVGSCDPRFEQQMRAYRELLLAGFRGFTGTVSSGGTTAGIAGVVGEVQQQYGDALRTIGYLPGRPKKALPDGAEKDTRYTCHCHTGGKGFTAEEPLQSWIDILVAGIDPHDVKVLGVDGGPIAALEYRVALALGATVAVLEKSGREAARLLPDEDWGKAERLIVLPREVPIVREYLRYGHIEPPRLSKTRLGTVARDIHNAYVRDQRKRLRDDNPALAPYDDLDPDLKASNLEQARHMADTLREGGCRLRKVKGKPQRVTLAKNDLETMAEVEHARYVVERMMAGWRWGKTKDVAGKISPALVGWRDLPEDEKVKDRDAVRKMPGYFAKANIEVRQDADAGA